MANPFTGAAYSDALSRVMTALVEGKKMGLSLQQMQEEIARQERQQGFENQMRERQVGAQERTANAALAPIPIPKDLQSYAGGMTEATPSVYNASYPDWLRAFQGGQKEQNLQGALDIVKGLTTQTVSPPAENYASLLEGAAPRGGLESLGPTAAGIPGMARTAGTTTETRKPTPVEVLQMSMLMGKAGLPAEGALSLLTGEQTPQREAQTDYTRARIADLAADNQRADAALASKDRDAIAKAGQYFSTKGILLLQHGKEYGDQQEVTLATQYLNRAAELNQAASTMPSAPQASAGGDWLPPLGVGQDFTVRPGGLRGEQKEITAREKAKGGGATETPLTQAQTDKYIKGVEDYWALFTETVPQKRTVTKTSPKGESFTTEETVQVSKWSTYNKARRDRLMRDARRQYDRLKKDGFLPEGMKRPGASGAGAKDEPVAKGPKPFTSWQFAAQGAKPTISQAEAQQLQDKGRSLAEIKAKYTISG